jgi:predicted nucleic-acid-binding protein
MKDDLNFHDRFTLYILRKGGHYDALYSSQGRTITCEKMMEFDKEFRTIVREPN